MNILYWGTPTIIQLGDVKGKNEFIFGKIFAFYGQIKSAREQKSN